jgi:hypothetical protein
VYIHWITIYYTLFKGDGLYTFETWTSPIGFYWKERVCQLARVLETELISGVVSLTVEETGQGIFREPKWFVRAISEPEAAVGLCQYWAYKRRIQPKRRQRQEIGQAAGEETILSRK